MVDQEDSKNRISSVLEDPRAEALAAVYANAFLAAAESVGVDGALEEFTSFWDDVVRSNSEFHQLLTSGMLGRDDKLGIIERVVAPHSSPLFASFLKTLARHDRLDLLPNILQESHRRHEINTGMQRVQVVSAREMTAEATESLRNKLAESLPFDPILEMAVDPSLLGGLVIRVGDTVYDSSLRSRLKQLRQRLRERSLHEIQSGRDRFSHPEGD